MFTPLRYFFFGCVIVFSLMQTACGQKGDLYLPEIPAAPNVMADRPPVEAAARLEAEPAPEQNDEKEREASAKKAEPADNAQTRPEAQNLN